MDKGASNSFKCKAVVGTNLHKKFGDVVLTAHRNGRDSDLLIEAPNGETMSCKCEHVKR